MQTSWTTGWRGRSATADTSSTGTSTPDPARTRYSTSAVARRSFH